MIHRAVFVSSAPAPATDESHIGGRKVRSETSVFLRQDPHALTVLAEGARIIRCRWRPLA